MSPRRTKAPHSFCCEGPFLLASDVQVTQDGFLVDPDLANGIGEVHDVKPHLIKLFLEGRDFGLELPINSGKL